MPGALLSTDRVSYNSGSTDRFPSLQAGTQAFMPKTPQDRTGKKWGKLGGMCGERKCREKWLDRKREG